MVNFFNHRLSGLKLNYSLLEYRTQFSILGFQFASRIKGFNARLPLRKPHPLSTLSVDDNWEFDQ